MTHDAPRYTDGTLSFTPPAAWGGPSMVAFAGASPSGASLVVTYERLSAAETISMRMQEVIARLGRTTRGLRVLALRERTLGGRPASEMKLAWPLFDATSVEQTSFYVAPGPDDPERMTVLVYTAPAGVDPKELSELLGTVAFIDRRAGRPAGPPRPALEVRGPSPFATALWPFAAPSPRA